MKTMSDFDTHAVVLVEVTIDGEHVVDLVMQPEGKSGKLGVAIIRWEDFSIGDIRDLLRCGQETLTRMLDGDDAIDYQSIHPAQFEGKEPLKSTKWPF